jgi:hypothetical protein
MNYLINLPRKSLWLLLVNVMSSTFDLSIRQPACLSQLAKFFVFFAADIMQWNRLLLQCREQVRLLR